MYTPLIIFLVSIVGISIMLARKLRTVSTTASSFSNSRLADEFYFDVPELENIQVLVVKHVKRYAYYTLVTTLRIYVKSGRVARMLYKSISKKAKELNAKYRRKGNKNAGAPEASRFLKSVGEYKRRINLLKERIKKEEGIE